jgi:integral membrane protein (TIGR00529 family)
MCLLVGSLILGLWMNLGLWEITSRTLYSLSRFQTISLLFIVGLILVISRLMKAGGHMDRIVRSFSGLSADDRTAGSVMPALIGLLPMPGGALFSAPMVDTALCRQTLSGEQKTAINYWFRHIWEYWWPIYPGVVLAVGLLEVETWRFMAIMAPMTLVTVLAGVIFILRPLGKNPDRSKNRLTRRAVGAFLWEIMPILLVAVVILALAGLTGLLAFLGYEIAFAGPFSILLGLLASLIWVCKVNHTSPRELRAALFAGNMLPMMLLVAAIMIFKGILEGSQAVSQIRAELIGYHIPMTLIIILIPFFSGFITGIAVGFVGTSFPLIIPLFKNGNLFDFLSLAALAYTFGYMGMMLSPVHLCLLVTKDHFRASLLRSYRYILLPAAAVMLAATGLFLIPRFF